MKRFIILGVITSVFLFPSCMTQKTKVGQFAKLQAEGAEEYRYAKGKQMWIVWGLIPIGRTNLNTPSDGTCEIVTRTNVVDILVTGITLGFIRIRTC